MKKIPLLNKAIALPLLGLLIAWLSFMGGILADLYVPLPEYDNQGNVINYQEQFKISPYLFLLGIAVVAICSLIAQRWAVREHRRLGDDHLLARAAHRFTNLALIMSMGAGAIYAIGNFMSAFNSYTGRAENIGLRFLNVYLPILLATALVVFVLLRGFTASHDEPKKKGVKRAVDPIARALRLGYTIPILSTAVAIIFGLIVYDVTKTNLQTWVWVIIIAIVGIGVTFGTRFASRAKSIKPKPVRARSSLAAGAGYLNLVLSIVFGGVVSIMGFSLGGQAIDKLRVWSEVPADCKFTACNPTSTLNWPSWKWLFEDMVPAKLLMLLAVVVIYVTLTERNKVSEIATKKVAKPAAKKAAPKAKK